MFVLAGGRLFIGRDPAAHVALADPELSRRHAVLTVTEDAVHVGDLGSTNGTTLDGAEVGPAERPLPPGAVLRCGSTTLVYSEPVAPPAVVRPDGAGRLGVHRPPRIAPPAGAGEVVLPGPEADMHRRFGWLPFVLAPALLGGVLWATTGGSPTYLLLALGSPLLYGLGSLADRAGGRTSRRRRAAERAREVAAADAAREAAITAEIRRRQLEAPDPATVLEIALGPGHRVWERRRDDPDVLDVRLGLAPQPARLLVRPGGSAPSHPELPPVPLVVSLRRCGVLGIAGPAEARQGVFRWVVGQLAALHAPGDLTVAVLAADDPTGERSWVQWLPHLRGPDDGAHRLGVGAASATARVAELATEIAARRRATSRGPRAPWPGPWTVVVVDDVGALAAVPGLAEVFATGPAVGVLAVCGAPGATALPGECGAVVTVPDDGGTRAEVSVHGAEPARVVLDGVGPRWAERVARGLAPLREIGGGADRGLPASVRLLDLVDVPSAADLAGRWSGCPRSSSTVLGVGTDGPVTVDLTADGPHVLVAGTTGAGKSELLQSLITGLALTNSPATLSFLLVDYKGGAAFAECARFPHAVGLVTDLDARLTTRALESLGAELRRRERLLAAAEAADLDTYAERYETGTAPERLARLVLVVDEFASLVTDLPDFVPGLVDIARRGRSLGVHLVLATQRPAGVVSADIRANTALRIALRVTDDVESTDVIDTADAARIPAGLPGRAYVRHAGGRLTQVQVARIGGPPPAPEPDRTAVRRVPWTALGQRPPGPSVPGDRGPTDLTEVAHVLRAAADLAGIVPAPSPWLPPLPAVVPLDSVLRPDSTAPPDSLAPPGVPGASAVPLGLADEPSEQRRSPFAVDLAAGRHLLLAGGPRSGRTTALRTLAGSAASHHAPADLHLYALDCGGGQLAGLERLSHCGAAVARDDTERGARLLTRLSTEVQRRRVALAEHGYASTAEQRTADPADRWAWMVLLLDSWEGFVQAYEPLDHARYVDLLIQVLREGPAAGLTVVVTGGRSLLTSRAAALVRDRVVLRPTDPADCALAGLPVRSLSDDAGPGRGFLAGDGVGVTEVQLAVLGSDPSGPAQSAELARIAELTGIAELTRIAELTGIAVATAAAEPEATAAPARGPLRIGALPARVSLAAVRQGLADSDPPHPLWTLLGVGGDAAEPVGCDVAGAGFLVAGPPGSGRSTALATAVDWHLAGGTAVAVVAPPRSPLARHDRATVLDPADGDGVRTFLAQAGPLARVVVVDDAELILDSPADVALTEHLARTADPRAGVIAAGAVDQLQATFRGLTVPLRRARSGLLLCPSGPLDGELLGVRLPRGTAVRPGRGFLVHSGRAQIVQVAQP
jgi:S-DNA-T family DNA segregation ATPase FtsK/SpoIIIE